MYAMSAADNIRDQVASAIWISLIRIAGGGYTKATSTTTINASALSATPGISTKTKEDNHHDIIDKSKWMEELKSISYSSVCFPNGLNNNKESGREGKPHDVEVRAAMTLFHRIWRGHRHGGGREKKGKRKRKKESDLQGTNNTIQENPLNELESSLKVDALFELISDLGTRREIDSVKSLANLLSVEMEKELDKSRQHQGKENNESASETEKIEDERVANHQPISFADIRPDDSGIICLVSNERSHQLHKAGRIPCPHCINWFKGTKGLWWHELAAHGINYSLATESAAGATNPLAIVPFQERCDSVPIELQLDKGSNGEGIHIVSHDDRAVVEGDAFDLVKAGKLEEFINLVEVR